MADLTTTPNDTPQKPRASELLAEAQRDLAHLRARLAEIDDEKKRVDDLAAARAAEREKAIANKEPPKLIGSIHVYLQDSPQDLLDRARPLFEGRVPIDRATKFRIDGRLTIPSRYAEGGKPWPLAKRFAPGTSPKVGEIFDASEMPAEEIARYAKQGVVVPIA